MYSAKSGSAQPNSSSAKTFSRSFLLPCIVITGVPPPGPDISLLMILTLFFFKNLRNSLSSGSIASISTVASNKPAALGSSSSSAKILRPHLESLIPSSPTKKYLELVDLHLFGSDDNSDRILLNSSSVTTPSFIAFRTEFLTLADLPTVVAGCASVYLLLI